MSFSVAEESLSRNISAIRRPSVALAFESERAEHNRRQEEKDREFQQLLSGINRESAKRNHSVQVKSCVH